MVGAVLFDRGTQRVAIEHRENLGFVGDLHRGRAGVTVAGDHMAAEPFCRNDELAAKLTGTEQENLCSGGHSGQLSVSWSGC